MFVLPSMPVASLLLPFLLFIAGGRHCWQWGRIANHSDHKRTYPAGEETTMLLIERVLTLPFGFLGFYVDANGSVTTRQSIEYNHVTSGFHRKRFILTACGRKFEFSAHFTLSAKNCVFSLNKFWFCIFIFLVCLDIKCTVYMLATPNPTFVIGDSGVRCVKSSVSQGSYEMPVHFLRGNCDF